MKLLKFVRFSMYFPDKFLMILHDFPSLRDDLKNPDFREVRTKTDGIAGSHSKEHRPFKKYFQQWKDK